MMQIYNLRYSEAEPERSHESRGWKPAGQQETQIQKQEDLKLVPSLRLFVIHDIVKEIVSIWETSFSKDGLLSMLTTNTGFLVHSWN